MISDRNEIEINMRNSAVAWLPIETGTEILCINVEKSVSQYLLDTHKDIRIINASLDEFQSREYTKKYDIVIAFNVIENCSDPSCLVKKIYSILMELGVLYLGTDNRMGVRYFAGDIDIYTETSFQGLEGYRAINQNDSHFKGRLYAKYEIDTIISGAGFDVDNCCKYYSVLPNLSAAQLIYAEDCLPEENLATRYTPMYRDPARVFLREEWMYDSLIHNNMFHQMANSYLIECHKSRRKHLEEELLSIENVTLSMDRGKDYACATIVGKNKVIKKALYPQGEKRLKELFENDQDLREHDVPMIESKIENGIYTMPRVEGETLEIYMQHLLTIDVEAFIALFDRYRDILYHSSDIVAITEQGPIMKRCYIDLVPLNCFFIDNEFVFFDQEFCVENIPINLVLWRALVIIYDGDVSRNSILSIYELAKRYNIYNYIGEYDEITTSFLNKLRNRTELLNFNKKYAGNVSKIKYNREKMEEIMINWEELKERNKETCFDDLANREIFVFGTGRYADEFICMYRYDYSITGILDNSLEKQEKPFYGYSVYSPEILSTRNPESYKVIICVKECIDIMKQLKQLGCKYMGIFDINYGYPGRQKYLPGRDGINEKQEFYKQEQLLNTPQKMYHVGYIAGVFDLFHLGHLNILKRAKEYCEYLIVGVVSDEGVRINKKKEPFVPFEERIELVRSCKYVDEAVEIPFVYCRTPEAFRKYHFDVQFSGSDYENDKDWLAMKKFLEQYGSTMIFFPYTQQTSSTKIKTLIERGLL